jgi:predicted enzyme related to lactoylglutathione lyase
MDRVLDKTEGRLWDEAMSVRTSPWPPGTPCWTDLSVQDVDRSRAFYESVLGWRFADPGPEDGGYSVAYVDGHAVAALGPQQSPDPSHAWLLHLASDDVDATAAAVTAHGGTLLLEPRDVGTSGRLLVAADPTGATFASWQTRDHIGAQLVNEPGGLTWEDLRSTDPARAQDFYCRVFGLQTSTVDLAPEDYRLLHLEGDEAPLGGVGGFIGPPTQSHWVVYFAVASTDDAVAAVERAGGSVVMPAADSPFGRMAALADLDGANFLVIETVGTTQPDRAG